MSTNNSDMIPPAAQIAGLVIGFRFSNMIFAAVKLGVADLLYDGPKSIDALAEKTGTHPASLYRLLRALESVGIFTEIGNRQFQLTPMAEYLRTDAPGSVVGQCLYVDSEAVRRSWENLMYSLKTGENAFEHVFGEDNWAYYSKHEEAAQIFNNNMRTATSRQLEAILEAFDFSGINTLVDVGGGSGRLLSGVLKLHPDMRGILQDLASPISEAKEVLTAEGVSNRCELVEGDFFESVTRGGDAYMMKWILHDWGDDDALRILKSCHAAMGDGTRLLVIDAVVPEGIAGSQIKSGDIHMLVINPGGRERTEAEFHELLGEAEFQIKSIKPTKSQLSIIEAVAV